MYWKLLILIAIILAISILPFGSTESFENETYSDLGYELLDNGKVFHMWNTEDHYYFNVTSGMQFTNHHEEYWSRNVFCGGYWNGDEWNVLACIDELPFTWNIESDNETYINVTGHRDISFSGYDARFAVRYHLKPYDTRLSVQPYIKNLGVDIPHTLGFAWRLKDINIDNDLEDNKIRVYTSWHERSLVGLAVNYTNTGGFMFITHNITKEHIFMSWNKTIPHKVEVRNQVGQYNSVVSLGLKIGTLDSGQEKMTTIKWIDARPFCDNVGPDRNEMVCLWGSANTKNHANYSDAVFRIQPALEETRFPYFKMSYAESMPAGCEWVCTLYRQDKVGGEWRNVQNFADGDCYNALLTSSAYCNDGYCKMLHTSDEWHKTNWDACIAFFDDPHPGGCSIGQPVYCGMGSQTGGTWSDNADYRTNMSFNRFTPYDENVTTVDFTNSSGYYLNVSFETKMGAVFNDSNDDAWLWDYDAVNHSWIEWYADGTYFDTTNITYDIGHIYQEDYNETTSNGTWAGFLPWANSIDGNWGNAGVAFSPNVAYGYVNYTKPDGTYSAVWQVKDNCGTINLTVPMNCYNANEDNIEFMAKSDGGNANGHWYCKNETGFQELRKCIASQAIWEEGMNWNTKKGSDTVTLKVNDLCADNISYRVQSWDTSYFNPTNNQTWRWSNISGYDRECYCNDNYTGYGNWDVTGFADCIDEEVTFNGNITIQSTGHLNITNSKLTLDFVNRFLKIINGGTLFIHGDSRLQ